MKKIISFISVLAMLISMMTTVAFADENNKLEWEKVDSTATSITLKLVLTTNKTISSAGGSFTLANAKENGVTAVTGSKIDPATLTFNASFSRNVVAFKYANAEGGTGRIEIGTIVVTFGENTKSFKLPIGSNSRDTLTICAAGEGNQEYSILDSFTTTADGQEIVVKEDVKDPTITLDPSPLTFKYGETKTITATTTNFDGTVAWEVIEGSDVISIDPNNTTCGVKALKVGTAKIQASAGDAKETVEVKVNAAVKDDTIVLPSEKNVKILDIKLVNATNHGQHIFISKNGADEKQSEKTIGEILRGEWNEEASVDGSIAIGVITDNADDVFTFDFR